MKTFLITFLTVFLLTLPSTSHAQAGAYDTSRAVLSQAGAPSGGCAAFQLDVDTSSNDLYDCGDGSWHKVGSTGGSGVTSVATTSPITGGTITTTGTIACATCVTSSSPGVGLAHFAGSTQAVTSSAVNLAGADVTGSLPVASLNVNGALSPATDNSVALGDATHRWTNHFSTALNCGIGGTTSCVITGNGSTSGTATITWPATAGTSTNQIVISNVLGTPDGTVTSPAYSFSGTTNRGIINDTGSNGVGFVNSGAEIAQVDNTGVAVRSTGRYMFSTNTGFGTGDLAITRSAAGVLAVGNAGAGDTTGKVKASSYMSVGTKFTSNNGCTEGTLVGGATAGKFTVGQNTACTIVITMGDTSTSPNGWACSAYDQTAVPAVAIRQTASNATTASLLMTVATNDVVTFHCIGY
jgi:hypothetical protein